MDITRENNLSETAFAVKSKTGTIFAGLPLPGRSTCAATPRWRRLCCADQDRTSEKYGNFETLSGNLTVTRHNGLYEMDFPAYELREVPVTRQMADALGAAPLAAYRGAI